jgi:tetratricopeptide (TPR) repeat protein
VQKPQWITLAVAIILVAGIYKFGKLTPAKKAGMVQTTDPGEIAEGQPVTIETFLTSARKQLSPEQLIRINMLEHSISRGDVKEQQIKVYHQLSSFWADSINLFEPYAWYMGEAARLENSEKNLTFAARLFLDRLQGDSVEERKKWNALQAKDLFERSLVVNPDNDSSKVGLGACYLFGNISANPMAGILKIRQVVEKDSNNIYAQLTLAKGSIISGQYEKAVSRLLTVNRLDKGNMDAILTLADIYSNMGDAQNAISWYQKSLPYIHRQDSDTMLFVKHRIEELRK